MRWQSALAIYLLFWVLSAFLVLPFGMRTAEEAGQPQVPGQAESAPAQFAAGKVALRTTVVSVVLFGAFYLNYLYGWLTPEKLDFFN
jgi:predicted secreted protein